MSRWLVVVGSLMVVLGLVGLTPLRGPALQAILLGPDSLVTPPRVHAMARVRDGRRLLVPVEPGIVRGAMRCLAEYLHAPEFGRRG